jgi:hypothetical protein
MSVLVRVTYRSGRQRLITLAEPVTTAKEEASAFYMHADFSKIAFKFTDDGRIIFLREVEDFEFIESEPEIAMNYCDAADASNRIRRIAWQDGSYAELTAQGTFVRKSANGKKEYITEDDLEATDWVVLQKGF